MKKLNAILIALAMGLLWTPISQAATAHYLVDNDHTNVGFKVRHMFSNVEGRFGAFSGTFALDAATGQVSAVKAVIETGSVDTRHAKRDGHLKSADFFDVEKHPTMTFTGKSFKPVANGTEVTGDLTLRGITKSVVLAVRYLGEGKDPWGNTSSGLTATTQINRKDFGMDFNKVLDTGGLLLGEQIVITLEIEGIRQ